MAIPEEPQSRIENYLANLIDQASAEFPEIPQSRIEEYLAYILVHFKLSDLITDEKLTEILGSDYKKYSYIKKYYAKCEPDLYDNFNNVPLHAGMFTVLGTAGSSPKPIENENYTVIVTPVGDLPAGSGNYIYRMEVILKDGSSYVRYSENGAWVSNWKVCNIGLKSGTNSGEIFNDYTDNSASGGYAHAEGRNNQASGHYSHAEGQTNIASGLASHSEGRNNKSIGESSHTEGQENEADGKFSHAEGQHTKATSDCQHVEGKYNIEDDQNTYAHIVGNGTEENPHNAHTVDWNGNGWFAGTVEGTAIIVKSSTNGSNKRFKITVNDSGQITATQI